MEAVKVMEEANKIIEDFTPGQYAMYIAIYAVEIGLCFWIGLKLL